MGQIKERAIKETHDTGVWLYSPLPFFVKFMGDGLLVLWDSSKMNDVSRRNVLRALHRICDGYAKGLLPKVQSKVVDAPGVLRCGIARGTVYSVGNGNDFVGSCINMAARIQKLPGVKFAFNWRGFDLEGSKVNAFFKEQITVKKVAIRGIGENELIAIRKSEFDLMSTADKETYRDP